MAAPFRVPSGRAVLGEAGSPHTGVSAAACPGTVVFPRYSPSHPLGLSPRLPRPEAMWVCSRLSPKGLRKILEVPGTLFYTVKKRDFRKKVPTQVDQCRSRLELHQLRPVPSPEPSQGHGTCREPLEHTSDTLFLTRLLWASWRPVAAPASGRASPTQAQQEF